MTCGVGDTCLTLLNKMCRYYLLIILALCPLSALVAEEKPNESTLTLVNDVTFNELSVTVSIPLFGEEEEDSRLSGDLDVTSDIDPVTAFTNKLTLNSDSLSAEPVNFSLGNFITGHVNLSLSNLGLSVHTPFPPGTVANPDGTFDASEHSFEINRGTLVAEIPGNSEPETVNFADTAITGTGEGNGTVTLTEQGRTSTRITYLITVTMPFSVSREFPLDSQLGDDYPLTATVTVNGTLKATSTIYVYISAYLQWTEENNLPGTGFDACDFGDIPNGILWSLGYDGTSHPNRLIVPQDGVFMLKLPTSGTLHRVIIESSDNLVNWNPVDPSRVSTGSSAIPPGFSTPVMITPPADGIQEYYRIRAGQKR